MVEANGRDPPTNDQETFRDWPVSLMSSTRSLVLVVFAMCFNAQCCRCCGGLTKDAVDDWIVEIDALIK